MSILLDTGKYQVYYTNIMLEEVQGLGFAAAERNACGNRNPYIFIQFSQVVDNKQFSGSLTATFFAC